MELENCMLLYSQGKMTVSRNTLWQFVAVRGAPVLLVLLIRADRMLYSPCSKMKQAKVNGIFLLAVEAMWVRTILKFSWVVCLLWTETDSISLFPCRNLDWKCNFIYYLFTRNFFVCLFYHIFVQHNCLQDRILPECNFCCTWIIEVFHMTVYCSSVLNVETETVLKSIFRIFKNKLMAFIYVHFSPSIHCHNFQIVFHLWFICTYHCLCLFEFCWFLLCKINHFIIHSLRYLFIYSLFMQMGWH